MKIETFIEAISALGVDHYTGVPDSQLAALCGYLTQTFGAGTTRHVVAANEGGAAALAAGHYLATGKPALVYLQNSGIGNIINPVCSLIHREVYAIPMVLVVGWRGEPGTKDEPQHVFQGKVTRTLLDCVDIENAVLTRETTSGEFDGMLKACAEALRQQRPFAFVVSKGALEGDGTCASPRSLPLSREAALKLVLDRTDGEDVCYVSTTGKLSRELFELREAQGQSHEKDFLTVGSMGHSIMLAQGVAAARPERRVFCLDGDGAFLMHMGSAAVAAGLGCRNLVHIVFNNAAHESVGGVPTMAGVIDLPAAARAFGYRTACRAEDADALAAALDAAAGQDGPHLIEAAVNLEVRGDLGRPTTTPLENRNAFMERLQTE